MLMFLLLVRIDKKGVNCDLTLTLSLRRGDLFGSSGLPLDIAV